MRGGSRRRLMGVPPMVTDLYCPHCGLRLWEMKSGGTIEIGRYWCRNMHYWTINYKDSGGMTLTGEDK